MNDLLNVLCPTLRQKSIYSYLKKLLKLMEQVIKTMDHLTIQWSTTVHLKAEKETAFSSVSKFLKKNF